ncbi:MAG: polysaccharide deacetylase family protein [Eubacteriales bacterium]
MPTKKDKKVKTIRSRTTAAALSVILCFAVIFTAFCASYPSSAAKADSGPTMFVNDEAWYDETLFGWEIIWGMYYVPATVFAKLDGVELKENTRLHNLMLSFGDSYITIDTESKQFAYTSDGGEVYMRTYLLRQNTLWLPAKVICGFFGFTFEQTASGSAIRISDGTSSKTLEDLLAIYNPSLIETETEQTTKNQQTPAPDTSETSEPSSEEEVIGPRFIYLTFEDGPTEYTGDILDLLAEYGFSATFFLDTNSLASYPETAVRIAAEGHSIGLHTVGDDAATYENDFDSYISALEYENKLLARIIKSKTRIIRAPDGSSSDIFRIGTQRGDILASEGYVAWDWNVNVPDELYGSADEISASAVAGIKKYNVPVLRMHQNELTVSALRGILEFISAHADFTVSAISEVSYEVNFIGLF